ncbi:glycosyltransferase family 4 protein [Pyxidicoccus xibeiensis]|uniref:glycosyltransferase family 4 protein n=1 Tax=Pyxidicoccus xibeiensis TaxID=2906759 RepID=UPI0020A8136D|nr:glycosyltransferase family 4 protein [Pyxidicoccus xibeiensis]MCP3137429.1 glycosyltransferase family 4 protein [Pyxidicoccus xibeiensis]
MTAVKRSGRRVVHVLRKYDPREWGGTETHVVEVTRRLAELGWRPEVHAPSGPSEPDRALGPQVPLVRYRAFCPFIGPAGKRKALVATAGNLASFDEPLRLVRDRGLALAHLHTAGRIGGAVRTAMRLTGRPYVISVHGPLLARKSWLEEDTARRLSGLLDVGRPIGWLLGARRVIQDAERVITFNSEERRALSAVVGDRAVRLDQGVNLERMASGSADRARERWPQLARSRLVTVVGRISPEKNQVLAVRAFSVGAPADHHLVLAGAAVHTAYREQLLREIQTQGVGSRVHIMGNLDAAKEVPDLMALSRLVLVPSEYEAFGLAVLEAWAASRPTMLAVHSGLTDLAEAIGQDGLSVPTLEVEDWAAALRQALASPERLEVAARAGAELVRRRFSWDVVVRKLEELYQEVIERGGRR